MEDVGPSGGLNGPANFAKTHLGAALAKKARREVVSPPCPRIQGRLPRRRSHLFAPSYRAVGPRFAMHSIAGTLTSGSCTILVQVGV